MTDTNYEKKRLQNWVIIIAFIFIIFKTLKFIRLEGAELPVPSTVFNIFFIYNYCYISIS